MAKEHPFGNFFDDFNGLFGDLFSTRLTKITTEPEEVKKYVPVSDLRGYSSTSGDDGMTLLVNLPGIDPKSLKLVAKDDLLVVS